MPLPRLVPPGAISLGLGLVLGGLLSGLLSLGVGRLLAPEVATGSRWVVECSSPPEPGRPPSASVVQLSSAAANGTILELHFLNADGSTLRTQHTRLIAGAQTSFSVPAQQMGSALRLVATDEVDVQVSQVYSLNGGPAETRTVPCRCRA